MAEGHGRLSRFARLVIAASACALLAPSVGCRSSEAPSTGSETKKAPAPLGVPDELAVATVGEEAITAGDLRLALARSKRDWLHVPAHEAPDWEVLKKALLDQLVERRRLLAEAKRRGLKVSDADVEAALKLARAGYGTDRFEETLLETGQTLTQFRENIRERLLAEALLGAAAPKEVAVGDAEAQARFDQNPQAWALPEAVRASQIAVRTEPEARKLRERLVAGESFEALARKHSVSPDRKKGGDLGFFTRTEMPKAFVDTCFALEPGKISLVTPSEYGYHLFKVVEKRPAKARAFTEVKKELVAALAREKRGAAEEAFRRELETRMPLKLDASVLKRVR